MPGRAHNPQNNAHQSYLQFVKFIFKKVLPHQRQVDREGMQEGGGGLSGFGSGSELISVNAPKNEMPFEMRSCQAKGVAAYLPLQIQLRQHKVSVGSVCCELVSKLAARSCRLIYKTKFDSCAN